MEKCKIKDSSLVPQLRLAISKLHEKGLDLRPNNVFTTNGKNIAIIDFDWAGETNKAKYPLWMNPILDWPRNAAPGQYIRT